MRISVGLALLPLLSLGLVGCSEDDSSSESAGSAGGSYADTPLDQIEKDVEAAMGSLKAVRLRGTVQDKGGAIKMDLRINDGDCVGKMSIAGAGALEIVSVDGVSYFKADRAFWASQGSGGAEVDLILNMVDGRWATDSTDPNGFGEMCDLDEMLSKLESGSLGEDDGRITGTTRVQGVEAVTLEFESEGGNPGVAQIAADDPHHILRIKVPGEGTVRFSGFGKAVKVRKPAPRNVLDLATLGG